MIGIFGVMFGIKIGTLPQYIFKRIIFIQRYKNAEHISILKNGRTSPQRLNSTATVSPISNIDLIVLLSTESPFL